VVRNTEVILGLAQLSLQTVHTGDSQHELGGVRPHLPWEKEEWRGEGERRYQAKQNVRYWVPFYVLNVNVVRGRKGGREGKGEKEREKERADLFSIHNCSRVQIDVDSIPVLTNFKTIHLHVQINVR
jgi:hypothetical protein